MTNLLLAADALLAIMQTGAKITEAMQKAQSEGRDITDEEMATLRADRREAVNEFLGVYGGDTDS